MKDLKSHGALRISAWGWNWEGMNQWKRVVRRTQGSYISSDQFIYIFLTHLSLSQTNKIKVESLSVHETHVFASCQTLSLFWKWNAKGKREWILELGLL